MTIARAPLGKLLLLPLLASTLAACSGDYGPQGVRFVSAENRPSGQPLLLAGNEISGTTTIYRIDPIRAED